MPKDLVYHRFTQVQGSASAVKFAEVLQLLPIIEENQDFMEIVNREIRKQELAFTDRE
jgi:hypothetical protein